MLNDALYSVSIYDMETLIAQFKSLLLDCFDCKLNYCVVLVH